MQNQLYESCRKLFRKAKQLSPHAWPEFIRIHCEGKAELERMLAGLLEAVRNPDPLSPLNIDYGTGLAPKQVGGWELLAEIGKGGSGSVYRARRIGAPEGGVVALKVVRSDRVTAEAITHFAHERKLLRGIRHSNIARILDSGETPDRLPYFVMEFVDGENISEYCRNLRLSIRQRVALFQQVCVAVHFLHDYGILHRDITPNNLMVMRDGLVKVVDFGISKSFDQSARTTEVPGVFDRMMTPAYASPEQLTLKKLSRQSDIYSMGVVFYELLTGALPDDPIDSETSRPKDHVRASKRAANWKTRPIGFVETSEQASKILRSSLDGILKMAMQHDVQKRYSTAELFRIDLARYLDGLETFAGRHKMSFLRTRFSGR